MVGEPVEQRGGHLGIIEDAGPFTEGQVGGDNDRGAFVELADQVEQQLAAGLGEGHIAKRVQDQEVEAGEQVCGSPAPLGTGLGVQRVHQIDDVEEPSAPAISDAGPGNAELADDGSPLTVVDAPRAGPAEEGERLVVRVEHHLLGLPRRGPHIWHPAVAQSDVGDLHCCDYTIERMTLRTLLRDMGDNWEHDIEVVELFDMEKGARLPRFVDGKWRTPPENVGGAPSFEMFLQAIADPTHEEHDHLLDWNGKPCDREDIEHDTITIQMGRLANMRRLKT